MELHSNTAAHFTKWVVHEGLLTAPFVLIDVGVQGGVSERWQALGDHLVLHGFDAIKEVVETLEAKDVGRPNRHYHWMAAGNFDGEQTFYFDPENPFSSSLYPPAETRFIQRKSTGQPSQVPVRRLDTLLVQGIIALADFLKVDVEGYEKHVLSGAGELLKCLLGFEAETAFTVSCEYPNTHFGTILDIAMQNHQRIFDIEFNRVPRASFQRMLIRESHPPIADQISVGTPATVNVLFCRNLIEEGDSPGNYSSPPPAIDVDRIIKQLIIYELYGLNDVALDTVEQLAHRIGARIDVDKAVRLLADPCCRTADTITRRIRDLEQELARVRQTHAEAMAEARRVLSTEKEAVAARVEELELRFATHAKAYVSRIMDLERQVDRWERPLREIRARIPRPIRRLARLLPAWKRTIGG